ncbi:MAG TPA: sulfite exporter TauE/SafE family protein [Nautiliaceae bacterium]|nr:sulfite exporter TauE/SafE family protein [Nautiliaceae bacterium]
MIEIFFLSFILSSLFAIGGMGSAIALIPILHFIGIEFNVSKVIGLFVNTATTITSTLINIKRKILDIKVAIPLAISLSIFAPIGALFSKEVPIDLIKFLFSIFLFFSATLIFIKKEQKLKITNKWIMVSLGMVVGFISGLLGIGGGALLMPALIFLGFDAKKMAIILSFVIPFSTFFAFLTYLSFVKVDWTLLIAALFGAIIGGYVGNYIMHFKLNQRQIKKLIALFLYIIAIKMFISVI